MRLKNSQKELNYKGNKSGDKIRMARSGGLEPPTAWFVARYSIQLSYERVFRLATIWRAREDSNLRPPGS